MMMIILKVQIEKKYNLSTAVTTVKLKNERKVQYVSDSIVSRGLLWESDRVTRACVSACASEGGEED